MITAKERGRRNTREALVRRLRHTAALATALAVIACGEQDPMAESCRGRAVTNCLPFELAEITSASAEPSRVQVGDPAARVRFHVTYDRCDGLEANHEVTVQLFHDDRLHDLLTLADDGRDGDERAGDGVIDKEVANPFIGSLLPAGRAVVLRFQTRVPVRCDPDGCTGGTCRSEIFEAPYELGPRFR